MTQRSRLARALTNGALLLVALLFGLPFVPMIARAFDGDAGAVRFWPNDPTFANIMAVVDDPSIRTGLKNSLIVATASMVLATLAASLAGYGLSRLDWRYREHVVYGVLLLGAIPVAVTMYAIYDLCQRLGLLDSYTGLVLTHTVIVLPLLTWLLKGYFDTIPRSLDEAAQLDGRNRLQAWWQVLLPLARTGVAVAAGLAFAAAWSEVVLALIVVQTRADRVTLPLAFFSVLGTGQQRSAETAALAFISIIPVLLVLLVVRRSMTRTLVAGTRGL